MSTEPPEYHTKPLSPLSPLPVHPPEPSNYPVLRNQIDPVFNMTSTHLSTEAEPTPLKSTSENVVEVEDASSDSSDSSFADAYGEPKEFVEGNNTEKGVAENGDDYAMTFDSDGEEQGDIQDVSQPIVTPKTSDLPTTVPNRELPASAQDSSNDQAGPIDHRSNSPSVQTTAQSTTVDIAHPKSPTPAKVTNESSNSKPHTYDDIASGNIDIQQLLDNITANAEKNEASTPTQSTNPSFPKTTSGLPPHASLPPRPQIPQKRPYQDDIQKYHTTAQGVPPNLSAFRSASLVAAGAPGTSTEARPGLPPPPSSGLQALNRPTDPRGGLQPPPSASFQNPSQSLASPISPASYQQINKASGQDHLTKSIDSRDEADDLDARWGPEVQKLYDIFLEEERMYVTEGLWDRFPNGSRLFIGNLPSEKLTKRDLFHVFHKYGRLAQVSIKQAYGFIQFHDSAACYEALRYEQGCEVRGRKLHLEISKPQKNSNNAQRGGNAQRRSRSPDYPRGGAMGRQGRNSHDGRQSRVDEYGRVLRSPQRARDDYRPRRSASPLRGNAHSERDFQSKGHDQYGRDRGRNRSRSPYSGQRDSGRYRERSNSPRRRESIADAELQIPRRDPRNVPDVQIILMEQLDRNFVAWVESEMGSRGIRTEVMFMNSRFSLDAIVQRQIIEGVHGISKLDLRSQTHSKVALQLFDRQGGADNVRWNIYEDLEPKVAAELVVRAKQTQSQTATAPQYHQQQYAPPQAYQPPQAAPVAPNVANIVGQLDNVTLQKLLGSLSQSQQQQNAPAVAANSAIDLASLLGGLQQQASQPQPQPQPAYQHPQDPYAQQAAASSTLSALLGSGAAQQHTPAQGQQSAQQVQNIMAQLAKFRQ